MKKVYLMPVQQHSEVFYVGKYDPRKLVKMADQSIVEGSIQEAQRPLQKKHLQEIAEYTVGSKGMLPGSVMIATKVKDRLKLEVENDNNGGKRYYINFPSTESELAEYENTIDIVDGQHRLFSFSSKYINVDFKADTVYDMPFSLFITPELRTRQLLFTITNEKQKAVSGNLLLWLKSKLGMLNSTEEKYLPVVSLLNSENMSPLKGRIVMSAEGIKKGYKAKELIKILDKSKIGDMILNGVPISNDAMLNAISTYINGWEDFYGLSYKNPQADTMTKISGLRYTLLLITTFIDYSVNSQTRFTEDFVKSVIQDLEDCKGLSEDDTLFSNSLDFRGEGATVKLAADDAQKLKDYLTEKNNPGFNPFV